MKGEHDGRATDHSEAQPSAGSGEMTGPTSEAELPKEVTNFLDYLVERAVKKCMDET